MNEKDFPMIATCNNAKCNRAIDYSARTEVETQTAEFLAAGNVITQIDSEGATITRTNKRTNKSNSHLFESKANAAKH